MVCQNIVPDVSNYFILAFRSGRGRKPDVNVFKPLISQTNDRVTLVGEVADAGSDGESNHVFARNELLLRTLIPPKHGRPSSKPAKGRYRRRMQTRFDKNNYRKRTRVERVMSMIKRRQGSHCNGRTCWSPTNGRSQKLDGNDELFKFWSPNMASLTPIKISF